MTHVWYRSVWLRLWDSGETAAAGVKMRATVWNDPSRGLNRHTVNMEAWPRGTTTCYMHEFRGNVPAPVETHMRTEGSCLWFYTWGVSGAAGAPELMSSCTIIVLFLEGKQSLFWGGSILKMKPPVANFLLQNKNVWLNRRFLSSGDRVLSRRIWYPALFGYGDTFLARFWFCRITDGLFCGCLPEATHQSSPLWCPAVMAWRSVDDRWW